MGAQLALVDLSLPEDCVADCVSSSAQAINNTTSELRRLLLGECIYDSIKFGGCLYLLTILGACFNSLTLLIIGWVLAFILPRIYEDNQDSIDELIAKVQDQYSAVDAKLAALFPASATAAVPATPSAEKVELIGEMKEE